MRLDADEFIRRFLIHVLPDGFHRIRHNGLFANANRANNTALARRLLGVPDPSPPSADSDGTENLHEGSEWNACPCCGRAYGHHRHLRTRLPASAVAPPVNRPRQLMTKTSCHPLPSLRLSDTDISPVTPTLTRWQPSAPPATAKGQSFSPTARHHTNQNHPRAAHSPSVPVRKQPGESTPRIKSP